MIFEFENSGALPESTKLPEPFLHEPPPENETPNCAPIGGVAPFRKEIPMGRLRRFREFRGSGHLFGEPVVVGVGLRAAFWSFES